MTSDQLEAVVIHEPDETPEAPDLPALLGMVHLEALPGTPSARLELDAIVEQAVTDAQIYLDAGFTGVIIENMHDVPYLRRTVGPEIVASMTVVATAIYELLHEEASLGIQVLAGANQAALAVAHASGAHFIRGEGFVFASVADEGLLDEADAGPLLRYRRMIDAEHIEIWADIKKKHSAHAITGDVDLAETARAAVFCNADALIITGDATGQPTDAHDVRRVREAVGEDIPIAIGSGVNPTNAATLLDAGANTLIVGSWCKEDGDWRNPVDANRVQRMAAAV